MLVFPATDENRFTLKLCDFGLAKVATHWPEEQERQERQERQEVQEGRRGEVGNGSSRLREEHLTSKTSTTSAHTRDIGTPAYMSPELLQGDQVDPAACDSYAMGILLWSMLSGGRHPYKHL